MANNYTQTAFVFEAGTPENAAAIASWIEGGEVSGLPVELIEYLDNSSTERPDEDSLYACANAIVSPDRPTEIYISTGEGDLEALVTILQYAMDKMPKVPSGQGFSWANTCSAMRCGEFGGGAVFLECGVQPDWFSTSQWLSEQTDSQKL